MTSPMRCLLVGTLLVLGLAGCATTRADREACLTLAEKGFRPIAGERTERFLGKVRDYTARCRGGDKAVAFRGTPWVDWANYWATGDAGSRPEESGGEDGHLSPTGRGIDGALLDLEYQRIELIKFNLLDNTGTYQEYVEGRNGVSGPALKTWDAMRLPKGHPDYDAVGGTGRSCAPMTSSGFAP